VIAHVVGGGPVWTLWITGTLLFGGTVAAMAAPQRLRRLCLGVAGVGLVATVIAYAASPSAPVAPAGVSLAIASPSAGATVGSPVFPGLTLGGSGSNMPSGDTPGWHMTYSQDFNGSNLPPDWGAYSGEPGGDSNGWWDPSNLTVSGGYLHFNGRYDSSVHRYSTAVGRSALARAGDEPGPAGTEFGFEPSVGADREHDRRLSGGVHTGRLSATAVALTNRCYRHPRYAAGSLASRSA
jgi:hypothetical protein